MADANLLARTLYRRKTKVELEAALDILIDESLESSQLRSQSLAEVGFTFSVASRADLERSIAIVEAAIALHDGTFDPSAAQGHFMDFSRRHIE